MDVAFTAGMEEKLDQISEGEADWEQVLRDFYGPFKETLAKAEVEMRDVKREEIPTDIICEKCGKPDGHQVGEDGPLPRLLRLPRVQEHQGLQGGRREDRHPVEEETTDEICEKCGKPMVIKRGRFGRFLACSGYPECKSSKPISIGVACPTCKVGYLTERRSRRGQDLLRLQPLPGLHLRRLGPAAARGLPEVRARRTCCRSTRKRDGAYIACPNKECDYRRDDGAGRAEQRGLSPTGGAPCRTRPSRAPERPAHVRICRQCDTASAAGSPRASARPRPVPFLTLRGPQDDVPRVA